MSARPAPRSTQLRPRAGTRRRNLIAVDVVLGLIVAVAVYASAPGLAIAALVALCTLLICMLSLAIGRGRGSRIGGGQPPRPDASARLARLSRRP